MSKIILNNATTDQETDWFTSGTNDVTLWIEGGDFDTAQLRFKVSYKDDVGSYVENEGQVMIITSFDKFDWSLGQGGRIKAELSVTSGSTQPITVTMLERPKG